MTEEKKTKLELVTGVLIKYFTDFRFVSDFESMHPLDKTESLKKISKEILKEAKIGKNPEPVKIEEFDDENKKEKPDMKECRTCGTLKESSPTPDGDEICPNCGDPEMVDLDEITADVLKEANEIEEEDDDSGGEITNGEIIGNDPKEEIKTDTKDKDKPKPKTRPKLTIK